MARSKNYKNLKYLLLLLVGFFLGITTIWPGVISNKGRNCFLKIIRDGSDGSVSLKTIASISPNYLIKIGNAKNKYLKILFIGDHCFR